jgi:hypothetical protein
MSNRHYQQQLIHQSASLQNNYTLDIIMKSRAEKVRADANSPAYSLGPKTRISDEIIFAICQSCFWCASCFPSRVLDLITIAAAAEDSTSLKCPSCIGGNIESIPIAKNENYRFDYNTKRGVVMEFFR